MGRNRPAARDERGGELLRCPSCEKSVRALDAKVCPICRRRVCLACLRPYGHHMRVCDECRLAEW